MYQVSFFQYPPQEIVAIDFILQDSVYIFTDGKSTVAAFPASVVSGIIHSVSPSEPDWYDEDYDDDEDVEPLTEEELMIQRLMNKAVENMYSDEALKTLKAQTPLDKIFQYKPIPEASGKEIRFFSHAPVPVMTPEQLGNEIGYRAAKSFEAAIQQTSVRSVDTPLSEEAQAVEKYYKAEEKTRADFKKEAIGILSTFCAPSAITNSPASGEQLPIDTANFLPGEWRAGYYNQAPFDAAMKQVADRRLEEQSGNESAANEAKIASEHYWDEKGDWSSPHNRALKLQPAPEPVTTDSLWSKYYKAEREARETLVALQDDLLAKQRQDSTGKETLDEDYELGPRPKPVMPKDSDLCSFESVIAGATFMRGVEGVNAKVESVEMELEPNFILEEHLVAIGKLKKKIEKQNKEFEEARRLRTPLDAEWSRHNKAYNSAKDLLTVLSVGEWEYFLSLKKDQLSKIEEQDEEGSSIQFEDFSGERAWNDPSVNDPNLRPKNEYSVVVTAEEVKVLYDDKFDVTGKLDKSIT